MKKWQDDKCFVAWLVSQEYAYWFKKVLKHHFSGDGIILYMYEAYRAGQEKKK